MNTHHAAISAMRKKEMICSAVSHQGRNTRSNIESREGKLFTRPARLFSFLDELLDVGGDPASDVTVEQRNLGCDCDPCLAGVLVTGRERGGEVSCPTASPAPCLLSCAAYILQYKRYWLFKLSQPAIYCFLSAILVAEKSCGGWRVLSTCLRSDITRV